MKIDLKNLSPMIFGASAIQFTEDGLIPCRFSQDNCWTDQICFMHSCSAGIRLAFSTDADRLCLKLTLGESQFEFGRGTVDILCNGELIYSRHPEAPWTDGQHFDVDADLPGAKSDVVIYLPTYRKTIIRSISLSNATEARPCCPGNHRILLIGDSITQGYGPSPSQCWAAQYARRTGRDFLNLGIGGAVMPGQLPDSLLHRQDHEIILAFGTNDIHAGRSADEISICLRTILTSLQDSPGRITVASPVVDLTILGKASLEQSQKDINEALKTTAAEFPGVGFLDGSPLLPKDSSYFVDGVHPDLKGASMLADAFYDLYTGNPLGQN